MIQEIERPHFGSYTSSTPVDTATAFLVNSSSASFKRDTEQQDASIYDISYFDSSVYSDTSMALLCDDLMQHRISTEEEFSLNSLSDRIRRSLIWTHGGFSQIQFVVSTPTRGTVFAAAKASELFDQLQEDFKSPVLLDILTRSMAAAAPYPNISRIDWGVTVDYIGSGRLISILLQEASIHISAFGPNSELSFTLNELAHSQIDEALSVLDMQFRLLAEDSAKAQVDGRLET